MLVCVMCELSETGDEETPLWSIQLSESRQEVTDWQVVTVLLQK